MNIIRLPTDLLINKYFKMKKIAVIYASKTGTTEMISKEIANTIRDEQTLVDVKNIHDGLPENVLEGYDGLIIGSSVRMMKVLSEANGFLYKNKEILKTKPVSFFFIGITMKDETPEKRLKMMGFVQPTLDRIPDVNPKNIGLFAGVLNIFKFFPFLKIFGIKDAPKDYRDWDKIREWAKAQKTLLLNK